MQWELLDPGAVGATWLHRTPKDKVGKVAAVDSRVKAAIRMA